MSHTSPKFQVIFSMAIFDSLLRNGVTDRLGAAMPAGSPQPIDIPVHKAETIYVFRQHKVAETKAYQATRNKQT